MKFTDATKIEKKYCACCKEQFSGIVVKDATILFSDCRNECGDWLELPHDEVEDYNEKRSQQ